MKIFPALFSFPTLIAFLAVGFWFGPWPVEAITHLVLAVGLLPLMLTAMIYFTPVLTRSRPPPRWITLIPFLALIAGGLAWLAVFKDHRLIILAGSLEIFLALFTVIWMTKTASKSLGSPHPGLAWYQASLFCLMVAIMAIMVAWMVPEQWDRLKTFHRHLNLMGCIGLTAVGTLQVLLPTVAGYKDPKASQRLHTDLKYGLTGSFLVAVGLAWWPPLAWMGLILWSWVIIHLLLSIHNNWIKIWHTSRASLSLIGSLIGFLIVMAHGLPLSLPLFFVLFLFPLVTGVLSHLLPLWWWPGFNTPRRDWAHGCLKKWTGFRTSLFFLSGGMMGLELPWGGYLAVLGISLFFGQIIQAFFGYTQPKDPI